MITWPYGWKINYTVEVLAGTISILLTNASCTDINKINTSEKLYDFPVFLTHTSLVEDPENVGIDAYRYIIIHISPLFTLTLLCGPSVEVNEFYDSIMKICEGENWMGLKNESASKAILD